MNMVPLRMAMVSASHGSRAGMFQASPNDVFGAPKMGQSTDDGQAWYNRGRAIAAEYDTLIVRVRKIANQQAREELLREYYGNPANYDSPAAMQGRLVTNIKEAESYVPVNTDVFRRSDVQSRVRKVNDTNADLKEDVEYAELTYGSLPDAQIIEISKLVSQVPTWVPYALGGAAVITAAALLWPRK